MTAGETLLGVSWASVSVGALLVSLRLYTRASRKALSWDDYTIAAASIVGIFGSIVNIFQVMNGAGQHVENVAPAQLLEWFKWTIVAVFQTTVGTCLTKTSICLFILRILGRTHKNLRRVIFGVLAFMVVITLAFLLVLIFQCRPIKAIFDPRVKAQCLPKHMLWSVRYALVAYSVLTDFFCASLPAFVIRDLQMSTRTKCCLSMLMGLGIFTAMCSVVRLATTSTAFHEDAIHDSATLEIFTILEENLGITVASIPAVRGVFQTMEHSVLRWSTSFCSLLGKHPRSAEEMGVKIPDVYESKATRREYYERREIPAVPEGSHLSKPFMDLAGEALI